MNKMPTVAEAIAKALARHGVDVIFGQSLPSALILAAEDLGIRQFAYRTENAGAAMADGYARISGRVAVVAAQNGPAATLLVPGLAEALKSSVPIIALVQDVTRPTTDRNAFQELDHLGLFQSCAKWVRRIAEPSRTEDYVDMAFAAATGGRPGPAVLLLPADLLLERLPNTTRRTANLGTYPLDRVTADPERIAEAAELLAHAAYPLVVAGGGVHLSGATAELATLQNAAGLPVMTTVMGKGAVDEHHPLSLGVTGNNMGRLSPARYLRPLIEKTDVMLLVGTRTAQNGTDSWTLYPKGARFIHIDIDGSEVGRNYEAVRLIGDARLTLAALVARLGGKPRSRLEIERTIAEARARHAAKIAPLSSSDASPIRPERLMSDLQQILTSETIVVADASYATVWAASYLRALAPGMRFLAPRGLAGLGWGLPIALGAKMAKPSCPVVCITGDGGFAHVWSELETARRMGVAVVVTVLNNGVLGYQKDAEDVKFGRHTSACRFAPVDHAQIARACGCRGLVVDRAEDYLPAVKAALESDVTTVLDVITDPDAYPPLTMFDDRLDAVRHSHTG
jgi:acetolactate synthase-1/2/3 large subunit